MLSSNELFHFTRHERLLNIIKEGFQPRYNLEFTLLSNLFNTPASFSLIPMVCFCDIPLNLVSEHSNKYGKSAIGLEKSWGERYGLNPVIYVHPNSLLGDAISAIGNSFQNYNSTMIAEGSDNRIFTMISRMGIGAAQLAYFVKQYERFEDEEYSMGDRLCKFKKGRFYDEREWRFVPPNFHEPWVIDFSTFDNPEALNNAHERIKKYSLNFDLDNIKVVVSENETQVNEIKAALVEKFDVDLQTLSEKIEFKIIEQ